MGDFTFQLTGIHEDRWKFFQEIIAEGEEAVDQVLSLLREWVSRRRFHRLQHVLLYRTSWITLALEDIYQPHNASAVLRTADALGIQHIFVVEKRNSFSPTPGISVGSEQWLCIWRVHPPDSRKLMAELRRCGYLQVATSPRGTVSLDEWIPSRKVTLWIGTELEGLSPEVLEHADLTLRIPQYGFVESLNLSVATALILYRWVFWLHRSAFPWRLSSLEQKHLLLHWLLQTIQSPLPLDRLRIGLRTTQSIPHGMPPGGPPPLLPCGSSGEPRSPFSHPHDLRNNSM